MIRSCKISTDKLVDAFAIAELLVLETCEQLMAVARTILPTSHCIVSSAEEIFNN